MGFAFIAKSRFTYQGEQHESTISNTCYTIQDACLLRELRKYNDPTLLSLQEGETISYKWLTEKEFIAFVNSDELIPVHKLRYADYFERLEYVAV